MIEEFLALEAGLLRLLGRSSGRQQLIRRFELFLEIINLVFERGKLGPGALVFTKGQDRLSNLVGVDLRHEIDGDHHAVSVQPEVGLLIKHKNQAGGVGSDFIFRNVRPFYDGDAFQIGRYLFQRIAFRGLGCQAHGVLPRVAVTHSEFTLGQHHAHLR